MKFNIWFDKIEGEWNVSIGDDAMPEFTSVLHSDCRDYINRKLLLAKLK